MKSKSYETYAKTQIRVYEEMIAFADTMKAIARKYNGKVVNRRFTNEMAEAGPKWGNGYPCFSCGFDETFHYRIKVELMELPDGTRAYGYGNRFRNLDNDVNAKSWEVMYNGPMDAEKFCSLVDKNVEGFKKEIIELRDCLEHFDEVLGVYQKVMATLRDIPDRHRWMFNHVTEWEYRNICELAKIYAK